MGGCPHFLAESGPRFFRYKDSRNGTFHFGDECSRCFRVDFSLTHRRIHPFYSEGLPKCGDWCCWTSISLLTFAGTSPIGFKSSPNPVLQILSFNLSVSRATEAGTTTFLLKFGLGTSRASLSLAAFVLTRHYVLPFAQNGTPKAGDQVGLSAVTRFDAVKTCIKTPNIPSPILPVYLSSCAHLLG